MRKKRQIIVIEAGHLSNKAVSGGDKLFKPMIPYLLPNYQLTVIVPQIAQNHWKGTKGVKIIKIPKSRFENHYSPLGFAITYFLRSIYIYKILKHELKPNIIIYSSTNVFVDWLSPVLIKTFNKNIKWVARIHHVVQNPFQRNGQFLVNLFSFLIERLGFFCFKKADAVLTLNQTTYKQITNYLPKKKVQIMPPGIDFKRIQKLKVTTGLYKYDAVFVGRIHYTKGVLDLIPIWKNVIQKLPNASLAIIGELSIPSLAHRLQTETKKSKLEKNIDILGFTSQKKLFSILSKTKVFLLTDHEAGFGLAALEAMAFGCPIVGWDIGLLNSIYKKGYKTAPLKKYDLFAKLLVDILKDDKTRQKLSNQAITESKRFDWSVMSFRFSKILKTT